MANNSDPKIGLIGIGLLGKALALALARQGYQVTGVHSRRIASAKGLAGEVQGCLVYDRAQQLVDAVDLVFITTLDGVIEQIVGQVRWHPGQGAVHCCGAASIEILAAATTQGAFVGAFHPCQTFAGVEGPEEGVQRLKGVAFAVSANGWLLAFLRELARNLGGTPISVPDEQRPLYHAASVLACGYFVALLKGAVDIWQGMGFTPEEAMGALYPLSRATLENVAKQGLAASATGPVMRGDTGTIETHLQALSRSHPELIPVYQALAQASLPIAATRGVDRVGVEEMRALLDRVLPQARGSQA